MNIRIDIEGCSGCSFKHPHRGHGECWDECRHPYHEQGCWGNILDRAIVEEGGVPTWCPLMKGDITFKLSKRIP